jgi:hypothetical protein
MTATADANLPTFKGVRSFGGQSYVSLSAVGGVARQPVLGIPSEEPPPATNGWTFWQFRDPNPNNLLAFSAREPPLEDESVPAALGSGWPFPSTARLEWPHSDTARAVREW